MTIKVGDKMPSGTFKTMTKDGPQNLTTDQLFNGKRVVLFSVPGAFTRPAMPSTCPDLSSRRPRSRARTWTRLPAWRSTTYS